MNTAGLTTRAPVTNLCRLPWRWWRPPLPRRPPQGGPKSTSQVQGAIPLTARLAVHMCVLLRPVADLKKPGDAAGMDIALRLLFNMPEAEDAARPPTSPSEEPEVTEAEDQPPTVEQLLALLDLATLDTQARYNMNDLPPACVTPHPHARHDRHSCSTLVRSACDMYVGVCVQEGGRAKLDSIAALSLPQSLVCSDIIPRAQRVSWSHYVPLLLLHYVPIPRRIATPDHPC
jgi:hypothetical protein